MAADREGETPPSQEHNDVEQVAEEMDVAPVVDPVDAVAVALAAGSVEDEDVPREALPSENYKEDLTLTDHLNKSLLQSFLARINAPGSNVPSIPAQDNEEDFGEPDEDR